MRCRSLLLALAVLLAAGHAAAASKHEQTRRAAGKKGQKSRSSGHDHHRGDADTADSCLGAFFSGCLSSGCDVAGQVAAEALAESAEERRRAAAPPAPGLEGPPDVREYEPEFPPEDPGRALPDHLIPEEGPALAPARAAGEEPPPAWMPALPAGPLPDDETWPATEDTDAPPDPPAGHVVRASRVPLAPAAAPEDRGQARPVVATAGRVPAPSPTPDDLPPDDFRDSPEAFGVVAAAAPPRPPPSPASTAEVDLRATGSWIVADLPNASFDARAGVRTREPGPGVEAWYTGLWERIDERWDHLPVGGLRLAFGFGSAAVRPELRLGGALLGPGDGDNRFGFDAGLGLEIRTGEDSPRIDLHEDVLAFEGLVGHDFGAGVSFADGPVYLRVGLRALYLGTFYAGPELAFGLRL